MDLLIKIIARVGLVLTILPSLLFFFGSIELATTKHIMIVGTIMWLVAAPIVQRQHEVQTG